MPQPGDALQPQPSSEDSFLDLLVETFEGVDESVRGQFLRQFFRTIAQIDVTETQSNDYWERILHAPARAFRDARQESFFENRHGGRASRPPIFCAFRS